MTRGSDFARFHVNCGTARFLFVILVLISVNFGSGHVNPFLPRKTQRQIQTKLENVFFRETLPNVAPPEFESKIIMENLVPFFLRDLVNSSMASDIVGRVKSNLIAQESNPGCVADVTELFSAVLLTNNQALPSTWTLHMMDSWGKMPSGLFSGHVHIPGDFVECVNIQGKYQQRPNNSTSVVRGSYCSTYIIPGPNFDPWLESGSDEIGKGDDEPDLGTKDAVSVAGLLKRMLDPNQLMILPFLGTCFPATCSEDEVQTVLTTFYDFTTSGVLNQVAVGCVKDEKPPLRLGHYAMIAVLVTIASLCMIATVFDTEQEEGHYNARQPLWFKTVMAFSLRSNTKKWLSTRESPDNLGCLHGLRTLSMAWIVLAHTWAMTGFQFSWNLIGVVEWYRNWSYFPMLNATVAVDTFFTMSGALLAYNLLRELDKSKGRLNYPRLILHRYLRITPTYVILVGMMATLLPYTGSGPQWYAVETESKNCEVHWWHNVLYINNLMNYEDREAGECYAESWYLANDMQFFALAPLVVYPLWKWKPLGHFILLLLSIGSVVSPMYVMHEKKLDPTLSPFSSTYTAYMDDVYTKPWTRCGPYVVGIILGYILYLRKKNPFIFESIAKQKVWGYWILSTVTALTIIYSPVPYFDPDNSEMAHTAWHSHLYGGAHRYLWGAVISWIIFACVNGNAGPVGKLLSWKVFMPLGRLTFCMYISSYHLQIGYHMSQVLHPVHVSPYSVIYLFLAHFMAASILAYFLMITLESPFIQLEKVLLQHKPRHDERPAPEGSYNETKEQAVKGEKANIFEPQPTFGWRPHHSSEVAGGTEKPPILVMATRSHTVL